MSSKIINGSIIAKNLMQKVALKATKFLQDYHYRAKLAVIMIGDDPASQIYTKIKSKRAIDCGIDSKIYTFSNDIDEGYILNLIDLLNQDTMTHGILVQLPLPSHINKHKIINRINPKKDVDCFTYYNVGMLSYGMYEKSNFEQEALHIVPCTPNGIMLLLYHVFGTNLDGKKAVVIGRSNIVGKPISMMLLNANCTVTILHSYSKMPTIECKMADILIVAAGSPHLVTAAWVKKGACVIDVGIHKINDKIIGDVDYDSVSKIAKYITPVPGGVGPMTVSCLLINTINAAIVQQNTNIQTT